MDEKNTVEYHRFKGLNFRSWQVHDDEFIAQCNTPSLSLSTTAKTRDEAIENLKKGLVYGLV